MKADHKEFQALIHCLIETMREELRQNQRLLDLVRRKKESLDQGLPEALNSLFKAEREVITDVVTMERDRIALLSEVGEIVGHPTPSRLRIAELLLYTRPEERDELMDLREEFRDVADELDDLMAVAPRFSRHQQDEVRLFVSPGRLKKQRKAESAASSQRLKKPLTAPQKNKP